MPIPDNRFGYVLPGDRSYAVAKEYDAVMSDAESLAVCGSNIMGSGAGKTVLLHKVLEKVASYYPVMRQSIGDCVAFGWAKGIMVSLACDIAIRGEAERWPGAEIATEWIYGTSRVLVGKGRLGNGDGSIGAWAARAVSPPGHGTLIRKAYGSHDLTRYSGQRAKSWGYRGLPWQELEPIADKHPVSRMPGVVSSYEQARDAIANGYPVPVCSNQGFTDRRDSQGFARASGRWAHCMVFVAVDDTSRPGLLCDNSWGANWISGPKRHDQPDGSFWVDASVCDRMLKQNDSFAVPGFDGYPSHVIDWSLW
jgi:hypothetical protein